LGGEWLLGVISLRMREILEGYDATF
jgi:hypothetical protein